MSTGSKVFMVLLLLVAGAVGGGLYYVNDQLSGEPGEGDPVEVEILSGSSAASIGEKLAAEGVVKNALAFRLVARTQDVDAGLQAGLFEFRTGMSVDEAIAVLKEGPDLPEEYTLTVREGLTVPETLEALAEQSPYSVEEYRAVLDERLKAASNADGVLRIPEWVPEVSQRPAEVREPYEGLLFPNTYNFFVGETSAQQILQTLIDQLDQTMQAIPPEQVEAAQQRGIDRYQALIMASLIERETQVAEERPRVASVISNRLSDGMPLQVDATVLYAQGKTSTDQVLISDTEIDSPYNTYRIQGLPPTPISGMGAASIQAVFAPENTPFRFYVLAPECDGSHRFAETFEEHQGNVQAFRDAGRCGAGDDGGG